MFNRNIIVIFTVFIVFFSIGCNSDKKSVVVEVNQEVMKELSSPPYRNIVFLTDAKNPISNVDDIGLKGDEIAIGLRKDEGYDGIVHSPVKFRATTLPDRDISEEAKQDNFHGKILKILKLANAKIYKQDSWELLSPVDFIIFPEISRYKPFFENPSLKILITYKEFEKEIISNGGGIKIRFKAK